MSVYFVARYQASDRITYCRTYTCYCNKCPCLLSSSVSSIHRIDKRCIGAALCIGNKVFRYEDITEVSKWQGKPSRLLRQWGSGGFGGYIGWFSGGGLGSHFEYVGKYQDAFYLKLCKGKPYMLSCDEVERVVEHIQSVISR